MVKNGFTYHKPLSLFLLSALAWAGVTVPLQGRIGERQGQIEDRLLADDSAQRMRNADLVALNEALRATSEPAAGSGSGRRGRGFGGGGPRFGGGGGGNGGGFDVTIIDTLLWQSLGQTLPEADENGVRKRPPEFPEYIYFKTDDGTSAAKKLQSTGAITGWELRVYLYKQLSGLEIYHRVGATLSDAEVAAILNANRGNTTWNRGSTQASTVSLSGDSSGSTSFIGYEYERADGQVRAHRVGNDLVLFSTELDKNLIKVRDAVAQAIVDPKSAAGGGSLANSTRGF
jgi:hypothetical protein